MTGLMSIGMWIGIGLIVATFVYAILATRRRIAEQREHEEMMAARFESQMVAMMERQAERQKASPQAGAAESAPPTPEAAAAAAPPLSPPAPAVEGYIAAPASASDASPAAANEPILNQLKRGGLFRDVEGYVEIHGTPKAGVIVRLTDNRMALVVPYHESEAFVRKYLRQYDCLIFGGRDGKAVVITQLESAIAERVMKPNL